MGLISWTVALFLGMPLIVNLGAYMIENGDRGIFFVQPRIDPFLAIASLGITVGLCLVSTYAATRRSVHRRPVESMMPRH